MEVTNGDSIAVMGTPHDTILLWTSLALRLNSYQQLFRDTCLDRSREGSAHTSLAKCTHASVASQTSSIRESPLHDCLGARALTSEADLSSSTGSLPIFDGPPNLRRLPDTIHSGSLVQLGYAFELLIQLSYLFTFNGMSTVLPPLLYLAPAFYSLMHAMALSLTKPTDSIPPRHGHMTRARPRPADIALHTHTHTDVSRRARHSLFMDEIASDVLHFPGGREALDVLALWLAPTLSSFWPTLTPFFERERDRGKERLGKVPQMSLSHNLASSQGRSVSHTSTQMPMHTYTHTHDDMHTRPITLGIAAETFAHPLATPSNPPVKALRRSVPQVLCRLARLSRSRQLALRKGPHRPVGSPDPALLRVQAPLLTTPRATPHAPLLRESPQRSHTSHTSHTLHRSHTASQGSQGAQATSMSQRVCASHSSDWAEPPRKVNEEGGARGSQWRSSGIQSTASGSETPSHAATEGVHIRGDRRESLRASESHSIVNGALAGYGLLVEQGYSKAHDALKRTNSSRPSRVSSPPDYARRRTNTRREGASERMPEKLQRLSRDRSAQSYDGSDCSSAAFPYDR